VRVINWFLFFLLLGGLIFGYYFYKYEWTPTLQALQDLQKENKKLLSMLNEKTGIVGEEEPTPTLPKEVKTLVEEKKPDEGLKLTLSVSNLFSKGKTKLKDSGKKLIKNFYEGIKKKKIKYREIEILIHPDPPKTRKLAAKRVLAVKYYFVKLGVNRNKVWAWVKDYVPQGKIIITVKK